MHGQRVLFVTAGLPDKTSFLLDALSHRYDVSPVYAKTQPERRIDRVLRRIGFGRVVANEDQLNASIVSASHEKSHDLLCVVKGLGVRKSTIEAVKRAQPDLKIVLWTPDNQALPHNQSKTFLECLPLYDVVFTTKTRNIENEELEGLGAQKVYYMHQAYSPIHHVPIKEEHHALAGEVVFIGYGENERFEYLNYLAEHGINTFVFGNGWSAYKNKANPSLIISETPLVGRDYAAALSNAAISLCFLRKINFDRHTSRTFEIPACGGFMLAERTEEQLAFYEENVEACYFDSPDELLEKVRFYLANPAEREKISHAGYERTIRCRYSYDDMAEELMTVMFGRDVA